MLKSLESSNLTWDFLKRPGDNSKMTIVVKGILKSEDALLCVENGMNGFVVSNHGGRGEDNGRSMIDEVSKRTILVKLLPDSAIPILPCPLFGPARSGHRR
jgi:4-hydroxymandelate oxidase